MLELSTKHQRRVRKVITNEFKASHLIFRVLGPQYQGSYSSNPVIRDAPKAFIHGNPHMDNYVRTLFGSGMVDFDRSRIGPYCWDLIRFLSSLQLSSKTPEKSVSARVFKYLKKSYRNSFEHPEILYTAPSFLARLKPTSTQLSTKTYLAAQKKWAKKLNLYIVDKDDSFIQDVLHLFLKSRKDEGLLSFFRLAKAARCKGSLGKEHILCCLVPIKQKKRRDAILLDIKETYTEENTDVFYSPVKHQGLRMIQAANLYAPNIEQRLGYFSYQGKDYWGREVPSFNAKLKEPLRRHEQEELAWAVGAQLGRAHALSSVSEPHRILEHFKKHQKEIHNLAYEMSIHALTYTQQIKRNLRD